MRPDIPYRVIGRLGACDIGTVWLAVDELDNSVTVAVLDEAVAADQQWRDAFAASTTISTEPEHPTGFLQADFAVGEPWVAYPGDQDPGAERVFVALGRDYRSDAPREVSYDDDAAADRQTRDRRRGRRPSRRRPRSRPHRTRSPRPAGGSRSPRSRSAGHAPSGWASRPPWSSCSAVAACCSRSPTVAEATTRDPCRAPAARLPRPHRPPRPCGRGSNRRGPETGPTSGPRSPRPTRCVRSTSTVSASR